MNTRIGEFQPADSPEVDIDAKWERWFEQQEKNGYAVLSRDEWKSRLDETARDGYAEGRKDEREESAAPELLDALKTLDARLRDCFELGHQITAQEAYDSFYREIVADAILKATGSTS